MSSNLVKVAFFPPFGREDATEFTDQYYRSRFYLKPVAERIGELAFVRPAGMRPGPLPEYLDPKIASLDPDFNDSLRLAESSEADSVYEGADFILHWNTSVPLPASLHGKSQRNVDRTRYIEECQDYLTLSSEIAGEYFYRLDESHERFKRVIAANRSRRCYIFGTGPNLSLASNHNFSQGVCVVCNSMVKNVELLDRMKPPLIVAADPIFHAGASVYAAEFREALYRAMERYGSYYLCNQRDFRIFDAYMPDHLRDRLIGAPAGWGVLMKTDTLQDFAFTACPNILTLFLLPIAFAMSTEEIFIAGCDGRPLTQNDYFWSHDKSVQFNDRMSAIQAAHPSFFDISYDDYYFLHCETVKSWIASAEGRGRKVVNMTPSFIPALRACYDPPSDVPFGELGEEAIPKRVRARMRTVFRQRQWRAYYHSVWRKKSHHLRDVLTAEGAKAS